jgi:very-short-patch-repair endonuclease
MRGVERSETAPYVQHAKFAIELLTMAREIPRSLLLRFAREQRALAVQAEAIISRAVRNRKCEGAKFQRQVPLGDYIIDFICFEHRLIVEIDGPSHEVPQQRLADKDRDSWLREQRFRILRLANELVIASTELAMARIRDALAS